MVEKEMVVNEEFVIATLSALEMLMGQAKTTGEQKLIYTMTLIMKECLDFGK